jgi:hypothetical protein
MKYFYLFISLFFLSQLAAAQNEIFLKGNIKKSGQLVDIADDKVKYITGGDRLSAPRQRLKTTDLVLVFNSYGDFLVFNNGTQFSPKEGKDFMAETQITRNNDLVFNNKGEVFTAKILNITPDTVAAVVNGNETHIAASTLVVIIKKNGDHQLFVSSDKAILYLNGADLKNQINQLLKKPEEVLIVKPAPVIKPAVAANEPPHPDTVEFKRQATKKIKDFENDIITVSDSKTSVAQANNFIEQADELFIKNAHIEVSSLNSAKKKRTTIDFYMKSLQAAAEHLKVTVSYADVSYATNFKPNLDGTYSAVATFVQHYEAVADGKVVYQDVTNKSIEIIVKKNKIAEINGFKVSWDVYLGDISVLQTDN